MSLTFLDSVEAIEPSMLDAFEACLFKHRLILSQEQHRQVLACLAEHFRQYKSAKKAYCSNCKDEWHGTTSTRREAELECEESELVFEYDGGHRRSRDEPAGAYAAIMSAAVRGAAADHGAGDAAVAAVIVNAAADASLTRYSAGGNGRCAR